MTYLFLKSCHVIVVLIWIAGLLMQSLILASAVRSQPDRTALLLRDLWTWDRRITTPALLLVWGLGVTIAMLSQNFGTGWLSIKLAIVFCLSGLHGMQSGILRRVLAAGTRPPGWTRWSPLVVLSASAVIVFLAVSKPF